MNSYRPTAQKARWHDPDCWLAAHGRMEDGGPMPSCNGGLVRVHLIPKQLLKREHLPKFDSRTYVYACGGPMGNGGHHGMLDQSRTLRVRFEDLPDRLLNFAEQHGLVWWLEREYRR